MTPDERSTGNKDGGAEGAGRTQRRGVAEPRIVSRRPARGADAGANEPQPPSEEKRPTRARGTSRRAPRAETSESPPAAEQAVEPVAEPAAEPANGTASRGGRRRRGRGDSTPAAEVAAEPLAERVAEVPALDTPIGDGSVTAALRAVREALDDLNGRVGRMERQQRLGVFVDVPNLIYGAERSDEPIHMGKLLDLLSEGRELIRATAYSPVSDDPQEPVERQKFVAPFVPYEYRIVTKPLKRFADGSIKGNFDVEMAIDMVTMAERLDVICIVSGDADFARVVEVIQSRGVRVEVAAFANSTSAEMRAIADHYTELGSIVGGLR